MEDTTRQALEAYGRELIPYVKRGDPEEYIVRYTHRGLIAGDSDQRPAAKTQYRDRAKIAYDSLKDIVQHTKDPEVRTLAQSLVKDYEAEMRYNRNTLIKKIAKWTIVGALAATTIFGVFKCREYEQRLHESQKSHTSSTR